MQLLLQFVIAISLSALTSAQQEQCYTPNYQKIISLEDVKQTFYMIGEGDNMPELKKDDECIIDHFKSVNWNTVSRYALLFKTDNKTQLAARIDYEEYYDGGFPTSGKTKGLGVGKEKKSQCYTVVSKPGEYQIFYCCHKTDSGFRNIVHFLSVDKFPDAELFETMKREAENRGLPVSNVKEISQEGCIND